MGEGICRGLSDSLLPSGTLFDHWDEAPTPDGNCAHAFYVLAILRLIARTGETEFLSHPERVLDYLIALPEQRKGHREFVQFALISARLELDGVDALPSSVRASIGGKLDGLIEPRFDSGPFTPHGNNWITLKALDLLLLGHLRKRPEFSTQARGVLLRETLAWQDSDGLFSDFPRKNESESTRPMTPPAYQAATCFFLWKCLGLLNDERVRIAARKGIEALLPWFDDSGKFACYGRSNHSIFGAATALCALEGLVLRTSDFPDPENQGACAQIRAIIPRILSHLCGLKSEDGTLALNPGSRGRDRGSWDFYMHHTVYNAIAAALLLDPALGGETVLDTDRADITPASGCRVYEQAGFVLCRSGDVHLAVSLQGRETYPEFELDPRFSGMNLYAFRVKGRDLVPPPPAPPRPREAIRSPGFLPLLIVDGKTHHPYTWRDVSVDTPADGVTLIQGTGVLHGVNSWRIVQGRITRLLRTRPAVFFRLEPVVRRLGIGKMPYRITGSRRKQRVVLHRSLLLCLDPPVVLFWDRVENRTQRSVWWRPAVFRLFSGWDEASSVTRPIAGEDFDARRGNETAFRYDYLERWSTALGPCEMIFLPLREVAAQTVSGFVHAVTGFHEPLPSWRPIPRGLRVELEKPGRAIDIFARSSVPRERHLP